MFDENFVVAHKHSKSPVSEAYKVLRTNIQYSSVDKPLKSIVVTSSEPMEGKTTTVINLAVAFAQAGNKVLLIDADLRKPKVHKVLMLKNDKGLTHYLATSDDIKDYIKTCDIPNLEVMTSGIIPPNPSELLQSNAMKQLIDKLSEEYDIILLDAPPVGNVTDASIISTIVGGTILVAYSGHVAIDSLKRAKEMLLKVNAHIIGVVLNRLDKNARDNKHYYQYYYGNDSKKKKSKSKES